MLLSEALRKDPHSTDFLESLQDMLPALAPVFDRAPKYAWIAKQLLEPERAIQFRVAWLDDNGNRYVFRTPPTVFYDPTPIPDNRSPERLECCFLCASYLSCPVLSCRTCRSTPLAVYFPSLQTCSI